MSKSSRRMFLERLGATAVLAPGFRNLQAQAQPPAPPPPAAGTVAYDLLIAGGRVVDPSQKLSAERDVAIAGGQIARIAANIPPSQARQVYDAKGKIVTPGLIDMHTHVYKYGITLNVDSDVVGFQSGVTTVLDCGSTGTATFQGFRKYVIETVPTRIYALLNISSIGLVVTNEIYLDPRFARHDQRAAADPHDRANRDRILGIKVRVNGKHRTSRTISDVMKTAREVGDATGLPIMMHWSVEPDLLAMLKSGDILAHPFNPALTGVVKPLRRRYAGRQSAAADPRAQGPRDLDGRTTGDDPSLVGGLREGREARLVPRCDFDRHQPRPGRIASQRPVCR